MILSPDQTSDLFQRTTFRILPQVHVMEHLTQILVEDKEKVINFAYLKINGKGKLETVIKSNALLICSSCINPNHGLVRKI